MKGLFSLWILPFLLAACSLPGLDAFLPGSTPDVGTVSTQGISLPEVAPTVMHTPTIAEAIPVGGTPLPDVIHAPQAVNPSLIFLDMMDEVYGWAITESQVLRTNDGGATWYDVTPAGLTDVGYLAVVEFLDRVHGWIQIPDPGGYPNAGMMYRTIDGGMNWASETTPFSSGDLSFPNADIGWMMADLGAGAGSMAVSVFKTTDGGSSWTRTYTNDPNLEGAESTLPLGGLKDRITAVDIQTAWIGGTIYAPGTVYLYRTDDGGRIWFKINLVLSPEAQAGELSVESITFTSTLEGVLALRIGGERQQTAIYLTNDGGYTWSPTETMLPDSGRLKVLSSQDFIFFGAGQLFITRDAARTWTLVSPDIVFGDSLTAMDFVNSQTGWVITSDPSIHRSLYKTTDSGKTWFPLIP